MANKYSYPGVYTENVKTPKAPSTEGIDASIGGFIGITRRGTSEKSVLISSWQGFIDNFAEGLDTPFMTDSDLAYSVYGFFQNGGTQCYISRIVSETSAKATGTLTGDEGSIEISAKDEGEWGNLLKVEITGVPENGYTVKVSLDDEVVETFEKLSTDVENGRHFASVLSKSKYISIVTKAGVGIASGTVTLEGGADGYEDITDDDCKEALSRFDDKEDLSLICAPGQLSDSLMEILYDYANEKGVFAILDTPKELTAEDLIESNNYEDINGAVYLSWIKVSDPLSKTGSLRDCPVCGHIMGIYARTISEVGVWKAPAGIEANIVGALDTVNTISKETAGKLNEKGINPIMHKSGYGIVVWGARALAKEDDTEVTYVSDVLLNSYIRKSIEEITQWAVFEPNNSVLWSKVTATVEAFLDNLWRQGGLYGEEASQAYYVKCDEDLNNENVRNEGKMLCEVGYASSKPAEFVIIRISHSVSNK